MDDRHHRPDHAARLRPDGIVSSAKATFEFSGSDPRRLRHRLLPVQPRRSSRLQRLRLGHRIHRPPEGDHKFEVRAIDNAGNIEQSPRTTNGAIDTTPPAVSSRLRPRRPDQQRNPDLRLQLRARRRLRVLDRRRARPASAPARPPARTPRSAARRRRSHLQGAGDRRCRQHGRGHARLRMVATPPPVSVDSGPEGLTNNASPTFAFSSEPGAGFECSIDEGTPAFRPLLCGGLPYPRNPARRRRPHLPRAGDRCRRQHGHRNEELRSRHRLSGGAATGSHRAALAGQREQPDPQRLRRPQHHRPPLHRPRLQRHRNRHAHPRRARSRGGGHGRRRLDHGLPRDRDHGGRKHLRLLGSARSTSRTRLPPTPSSPSNRMCWSPPTPPASSSAPQIPKAQAWPLSSASWMRANSPPAPQASN